MGTESSLFARLRRFARRPAVVSAALFVATFAVFAWIKHWRFAAFVMGILAIHESGHLWMMRRVGLKVRNLYFIPLMGAMITTDGRAKTDRENFDIAIMGPAWGFGSALLLFAGYAATGNPGLAAGAFVAAVLNLVNMFPFRPLDGGQMVGALNPLPHPYLVLGSGVAGIAFSIWLTVAARNPLWLILAYAAGRSAYDQLVGLTICAYRHGITKSLAQDPIVRHYGGETPDEQGIADALDAWEGLLVRMSPEHAKAYLLAIKGWEDAREKVEECCRADHDFARTVLRGFPLVKALETVPKRSVFRAIGSRNAYQSMMFNSKARRNFLTMTGPVPMTDRERLVRKIAYVGLLLLLSALTFAAVNMPGAFAALKANF